MTTVLESPEEDHVIDIKGPLGGFEYIGKGKVQHRGAERKVDRCAIVCTGSGITPIYQVLWAVLQDPKNKTTCIVVNGNRLEEDI